MRRLDLLWRFLALGGGFVLVQWLAGTPTASVAPLVVTPTEIEALAARFQKRYGRQPSRSEIQQAADALVRETLLVREARRLGMHHGDLVVRRRLLEKMSLLALESPIDAEESFREALDLGLDRDDPIIRRRLARQVERLAVIADGPIRVEPEAVHSFYDRHQDHFSIPKRYGFRHVFVRAAGDPAAAHDRAARLLKGLRAGPAVAGVAELPGDAFPLGSEIPSREAAEIAAEFGPSFSDAVSAAVPGQWIGPIASAFGWHLVLVEAVEAPRVRPLEEVRTEILQTLRAEAEQQRIERALAGLRASYRIEILWPESWS